MRLPVGGSHRGSWRFWESATVAQANARRQGRAGRAPRPADPARPRPHPAWTGQRA
ncbi:hypothetical protein GLE_2092 [Lysobacter enzymogenes]|uniref:Uncharacterized protein n=1 Tax=Lysobacter enzymogenes TaxID=69 RepID=A0A0S2DG36_LYSEN|nr:hypothetical protein GLE_2092 [Lysobacter enzymogenes]